MNQSGSLRAIWDMYAPFIPDPIHLIFRRIIADADALKDPEFPPDLREVQGRILLEQGLLHHILQNDKPAAEHFVRAAKANGLQYELTGAPGKRTKFQQFDVTQLVLLAQSRKTPEDKKQSRREGSNLNPAEANTRGPGRGGQAGPLSRKHCHLTMTPFSKRPNLLPPHHPHHPPFPTSTQTPNLPSIPWTNVSSSAFA
jgi:hypothetical protein